MILVGCWQARIVGGVEPGDKGVRRVAAAREGAELAGEVEDLVPELGGAFVGYAGVSVDRPQRVGFVGRARLGGGINEQVGDRVELLRLDGKAANFLTSAACDAAGARTERVEAHQSFDHQRLWADLLSSQALAFNLFGDLAADLTQADRAVHEWFPEAPGRVRELRFAHSPGRFDPAYLNSLRAFTVAFILDLDDGTSGVVAVDVKYHERNKSETPRPENLHRYTEVAEHSRVFAPGSIDALARRGDLCVMWLEHLLQLSMLQHPSRTWTWGRYIVVHPAGNSDIAAACNRYHAMLADEATFATMTLEQLLDTGTLPEITTAAVHERYVSRGAPR